jgi:uncharacterized protein (DUF1501 family)
MLCEDLIHPSRRAILGTAGALFAWSFAPRAARAAGAKDPRFVTIILRGALDGLSAVAPVGDPHYAGLREGIALSIKEGVPALPLDNFFALHPALPQLQRLFAAKQALVVHACATGYRDRSHFDGQDVLESGMSAPGHTDSGWLNRALAALPKGERITSKGALGVGSIAPLIVRGETPVLGWAPQNLPDASIDLARRVQDLYNHTDPVLAASLSAGLETEAMAKGANMRGKGGRGGPSEPEGMANMAQGVARLMSQPDGPRVAALALEGWDTHANEGGATGQLARRLGGLDAALAALEKGLGAAWGDTVVAVITEFGRTAQVNGTGGSDHGTATICLLVGGAVKGGRVVADWPGLKPEALLDGRDLAPTTDLRSVLKGVMIDHLGLEASVLAEMVFPGSANIKPMRNLVQAG